MCKNKALTELGELKPLESRGFLFCWTMLSQSQGQGHQGKQAWVGGSFPLISHAVPLRELLQGLQQTNVLLKAILMKSQD